MRKHRRFDKVSNIKITVQVPVLSPRGLMNLLSEDVEVDLKTRSGSYGNGSGEFPIPRSMNISRLSNMIPEKNNTPPTLLTPPSPPAPPTPPNPPE